MTNAEHQRAFRQRARETGRCVRCGGERDKSAATCSACHAARKEARSTKTLAALKRRCAVGTVLVMTWRREPSDWTGIRLVVEHQGTATVGLRREDQPGAPRVLWWWLEWPRARNVRIESPDSFVFVDECGDRARFEIQR